MSAANSTSAVATRDRSGVLVNDESLDTFSRWVGSIATPEEIAWNSDKFHDIRDWLVVHHAAKDLRIKAVRIECIALRRVGRAGLTEKLKSQADRRAAKWLSDLSDERFDAILADSKNTVSPCSVRNYYVTEEEGPSDWVSARASRGFAPHRTDETGEDIASSVIEWEPTDYSIHLTGDIESVLSDICRDDESFTVADAADRLLRTLQSFHAENHEDLIPPELAGEPLREVVRRVLRAPGPADKVYIGDTRVVVPRYVTFQPPAGENWQRVPWTRAALWQFRQMVELREAQAAQAQAAADNMRSLYESLAARETTAKTDRVADLIGYADLKRVS